MGIIIGRHIGGVTLNPLEYVLHENNEDILEFPDKATAECFLLEAGADPDDLYYYHFIDENDKEV